MSLVFEETEQIELVGFAQVTQQVDLGSNRDQTPEMQTLTSLKCEELRVMVWPFKSATTMLPRFSRTVYGSGLWGRVCVILSNLPYSANT